MIDYFSTATETGEYLSEEIRNANYKKKESYLHKRMEGSEWKRIPAYQGLSATICVMPLGGFRVSCLDPWLGNLLNELGEMGNLSDNWNGYGSEAPNEIALGTAENILHCLQQMEIDLEPDSVVPSAEDGIGIVFSNGNRQALIECSNEDEIVAVTYGKNTETQAWPVPNSTIEIKETLNWINAYINGSHHS
ncbi:MAG: hypothetical protein HQ583_08565 [Candidatus Abyssubacteria bacterium]|nr:hypothetical protein [Candidatus Abyssubacteria bacterium]